ncbi:MAG: hypothetical protein ACLRNQ_06700 [Flavonifractor plautii]
MIFYFSGTGNSRYCAKRLAHRLGDEAVDAFPFLRDDHFPALTSRSPWVFVSPTYGWRLPAFSRLCSAAAGFRAAGTPTLS